MLFVRSIRSYFLIVGVITHLLLISFLWMAFSDNLTSHWRWKQMTRLLSGPLDSMPVTAVEPVDGGRINPGFQVLPKGRWIKIHQQKTDDAVTFKRQRHGGSAFDSKRGRLILFGSDTHGEDWSNVIRIFDLAMLRWEELGKSSPPDRYTVTADGIPVTSDDAKQPWAMHTFDALAYDPLHDRLIVASHPKHLEPGRFGDWLSDIWSDIRIHPTWLYNFTTGRWRYEEGNAVSFFPYASAYDNKRGRLLGIRPDGIFQFLDREGWTKVAKKGPYAYHTSAVYDSKSDAVVIFGDNSNSNTVWLFRLGTEKLNKQLTKGVRPPGAQSVPLSYHPEMNRVITLVDNPQGDPDGAQTWLYETAADSWTRLPAADFPFRLGMNYNMQYDNLHNQLVLVASAPEEPPSVWILRL